MVVLQAEISNATLTVGTDIFDLEPFVNHKMSKRNRKVKSISLTGDNATDTMLVDLYYGPRLVASGIFNNTGLGNTTAMQIPIVGGDFCHVDEPIKLVVTDAPAASAVNVLVKIS